MIKNLIAPMQKVLIQKRLCPACTRSLDKAKLLNSKSSGINILECECGRIFIYDKDLDIFRRALPEEI
jgi:predicted  nucleic acid-binding Zn-ribbon protein